MKTTVVILTIIFLVAFIGFEAYVLIFKTTKKERKNKNPRSFDYNNGLYYKKLYFMRKSEFKFFKVISVLENEYNVVPKIYLKTIIKTSNRKFKSNLNEYVDYAIFNKDFSDVLLLIELNDSKYEDNEILKKKIAKVKNICDEADIKFITFSTNKLNEEEAIEEIKKILRDYI